MEKRCNAPKHRNIIRWSTVILAVLFVVLFIRSDNNLNGKEDSPALNEMKRLYKCELNAINQRREAYLQVFTADNSNSLGSIGKSSLDLDILCVTDSVISFVIHTSGESAPLYGRDRYYNIDKKTGDHLSIVQVLGKEYREIILDAILPKAETDKDVYKGIDIASMINKNRPFYIAGGGRDVMIVFDKGEIAPDKAGTKIYRVEKK